jgi:AcrR family transcriptional regulator
MARTGRRPGTSDTRGQVLTAAREQFAARGYGGATIRGIAAAASVDPALVHHYFGTKRELFVEAIEFPIDPATIVAAVTAGGAEGAGERMLRALLGVWGTPEGRAMMQSILRSLLGDDDLLSMFREFLLETVLLPVTAAVAPDRPELRASLLASQVAGLGMTRYLLELEPLASADEDTVVAAIAPTVQRYLTGDID